MATFLLGVAKFAWDIYHDRKKDTKTMPPAEAIARTIRLELKGDEGVSTERRDRIISVVVEEMLNDPPKS